MGAAEVVGAGPLEDVGVPGEVAVGVGPADVAPPEQRLVERASAACRSADGHLDIRHEPATDWKAEVQRQAVSVSPLQPCLLTAS